MAWAIGLTLILHLVVLYTPFFQDIFDTHPLTALDFMIAILASLFMLLVVEFWKWIKRFMA